MIAPSKNAHDPAHGAQRHRFHRELRQDCFLGRANRLAHANLARRSVTLTSMMFITPTPPTISPTLDTAIMKQPARR